MTDEHKEQIGYISPEPVKKGFLGIGRKQTVIDMLKDTDGLRLQFSIVSNGYQDRDNETITTKALEGYVAKSWVANDKCMPNNEFMFWHKIPIGDVIYCDIQGSFLWEVSKERAGTFEYEGESYPISLIWDYIEQHPDEQWGTSHGFKYLSSDRDDGVYEWIDKFETSVLPLRYAANPYTFSGVLQMEEQKDHRGAFLDKLLNREGVADKLRKAPTALEAALDAAGVQHKAMQSDAAPAAAEAPETPAQEGDEATAVLNAVWAVIEANNQKEGVTTEQVKQQLQAAIQQQLAAKPAAPPPPVAKALQTDDIGQLKNPMDAVALLTKQNSELTDSQAQLAKDQGEIVKAYQAIVPVVNALGDIPTQIKALTDRLAQVEAQVTGRPRIASQDASTQIDEKSLSKEVQKSMEEYQTFLGVPVKNIPK